MGLLQQLGLLQQPWLHTVHQGRDPEVFRFHVNTLHTVFPRGPGRHAASQDSPTVTISTRFLRVGDAALEQFKDI